MPLTVNEFAAIVKQTPNTIRKKCRLRLLKARKLVGGKSYLIYEDPTVWVAK